MTKTVRIVPSGRTFVVQGNETLLEAALASGLRLDYGCSNGHCGRCRARVVSGSVERVRHSDFPFRAAEQQAGHILLCACTATSDLLLEADESDSPRHIPVQTLTARVRRIERLGGGALGLELRTPRSSRLRFLAGQHATLRLADGTAAQLPIASCPCEERTLQFHLPLDGAASFGRALVERRRGPSELMVEGPRGEFVLDEQSRRPLLFVAFDTGFAAVKSLIEHAMAIELKQPMTLWWFASEAVGHYMHNLARSWDDAFDHFDYQPLSLEAPHELRPPPGATPWHELDVYLAGPSALLQATAGRLLELGVPPAQLRCGDWSG